MNLKHLSLILFLCASALGNVVYDDLEPATNNTYDLGALTFQWKDAYIAGTTTTNTLIVTSSTPATASSTGVTGTITWDSDYIYVCVATDTWKRAAITTWAVVTENVIFAGENVIFAAEQVVYP